MSDMVEQVARTLSEALLKKGFVSDDWPLVYCSESNAMVDVGELARVILASLEAGGSVCVPMKPTPEIRDADEIEKLRADYEEVKASDRRRYAEVLELRAALMPFAAIGQWLFARPEVPDDQPLFYVPALNGYDLTLTRGHFKAAYTACDE